MRIMLDTNVLVSSLVFPNERMNMIMFCIFSKHDLILSTYILDELRRTVKNKFPAKTVVIEKFISKINYELLEPNETLSIGIRDSNDLPILKSALGGSVDVLITGDKDFLALNLKHPRIMSPSDFFDEFVVN